MAESTALDFDFERFSVNVIKSIDDIRSYGSNKVKNTGPIESRVNAFYRALGLPAVVNPDNKKLLKDPTNVGNAFLNTNKSNVSGSSLSYDEYAERLTKRENDSKRPATDFEYESLLHFSNRMPSDSLEKRVRGKLFPIVVNGDIEIYPQDKRVATPFIDEDDRDTGGGVEKLRQPLIESIVYIRLKNAKIQDSSIQSETDKAFAKYFSIPGEDDLSKTKSDNELALNLQIAAFFRQAMQTGIELANQAAYDANVTVQRLGDNYQLSEDNVAEQNPSKSDSEPKAEGDLDIQEQALNEKQRSNQFLLSMIEFKEDSGFARNATDNVLFSDVLSVITPNAEKIESDRDSVKEQKQKATEVIKSVLKRTDLFNGDLAGISAMDVLVVTSALFEIPLNTLLALLNTEAANNLLAIKGDSVVTYLEQAGQIGVKSALSALEAKVKALYTYLDSQMVEINTSQAGG